MAKLDFQRPNAVGEEGALKNMDLVIEVNLIGKEFKREIYVR